jgi:hypothetical protein
MSLPPHNLVDLNSTPEADSGGNAYTKLYEEPWNRQCVLALGESSPREIKVLILNTYQTGVALEDTQA